MENNSKGGDTKVKKFYGGKFLNKLKLEEEGIFYPIKLEYYKRIEEKTKEGQSFGITIVKTEYIPDNIKIETRSEERPNIYLGLGFEFEFGPQRIRDIAIVCP